MFKLAKKKEMVGFIEWDKRENDSITLSCMHVKYAGGGLLLKKGWKYEDGKWKRKKQYKDTWPR